MSRPSPDPVEESLVLIRENFTFQCENARERMERGFLHLKEDNARQLRQAIDDAVDSVPISLRDLHEACRRGRQCTLSRRISDAVQARTRPVIETHVARCCRTYADELQEATSAIFDALPPDARRDVRLADLAADSASGGFNLSEHVGAVVMATTLTGTTNAVASVVREQALGAMAVTFLALFTAFGWPLIIGAGIFSAFTRRRPFAFRSRLRRRLKQDLKPRFGVGTPEHDQATEADLFQQVWRERIAGDRARDAQRLWTGHNPDGSPVTDQQGDSFPGIEPVLRRTLGMKE